MFFKPVIEKLGIAETAVALDVPTKNIRRWVDNDSIPADWFAAVVRYAQERGLQDITLERLAEIAEDRRLARTPAPPQAAA